MNPYGSPSVQPQPKQWVEKGMGTGEHFLHFVLTVCTLGCWFPVWAVLAVVKGKKRMVAKY